MTGKPYTKWYNVHERYTWNDFRAEGLILIIIAVVLTLHLFGSRKNGAKARAWIRAHAKPLSSEFAIVGFSGVPAPSAGKSNDELLEALETANVANPDRLLKKKSLYEYCDVRDRPPERGLCRRQAHAYQALQNPFMTLVEVGMGFLWRPWARPRT